MGLVRYTKCCESVQEISNIEVDVASLTTTSVEIAIWQKS
jgi:hypothetical protein